MSNAYPPGGPQDQQGYQPGYPQGAYAQPAYVYTGFWMRVLAFIIDALVLNVVLGLLGGAAGFPTPMSLMGASPYEVQRLMPEIMQFNIASVVINWLYFAVMESSSWQGTLGKKALGIIVTDYAGQRLGFGQATGRYFGKILSAIIIGIGFLMVAFTQRKQGLHDIVAGTLVVRRIG